MSRAPRWGNGAKRSDRTQLSVQPPAKRPVPHLLGEARVIGLAVAVSAAVTAIESWVAMLLIGALHSEAPEVPALSFTASMWLVVLVNVLVGSATAAGSRTR